MGAGLVGPRSPEGRGVFVAGAKLGVRVIFLFSLAPAGFFPNPEWVIQARTEGSRVQIPEFLGHPGLGRKVSFSSQMNGLICAPVKKTGSLFAPRCPSAPGEAWVGLPYSKHIYSARKSC